MPSARVFAPKRMGHTVTVDEIAALFTRRDGQYLFARWARAIVPVVFGVTDETLAVMKGALTAVVAMAGHEMAEADPELGANLMIFFCSDWAELPKVPNLDRLIPDLALLCDRLTAADANQYRIFRFDTAGAIKAAFVLLRMDDNLSPVSADVLALSQAVQIIVLWSDCAFEGRSAIVDVGMGAQLRPHIGAVIRAGYAPVLPPMARDPSHALRLFARMAAT